MKRITIFPLALFSLLFAQSSLIKTNIICDSAFYADITSNPQVYRWVDIDSVAHTWNYHSAMFDDDNVSLTWYIRQDGCLWRMEKVINRFSILEYK